MGKRSTLLFILLLSSLALSAQDKVKPGTVTGSPAPAFDCYRSFQKEPETSRYFATEIGIGNRCFFASNTINGLGEYYCEYPPVWVKPGVYEWEHFDAQMQDVMRDSPDCKFLCMIDLNTPYWAIRKYGMDSFSGISHFACNEKWLKATEKWLADFIAYAESRYGDVIFSYILSGGATSEWYESGVMRGYSSANKDAGWRKWCAANGLSYGPNAPSFSRLYPEDMEGFVYDPRKDAEVIDYWRFNDGSIADAIIRFASFARKRLPADKLLGVFFGYYFIRENMLVSFGHSDYERVFHSPDLDFAIAPGSYTNREIGQGTGSQLVPGSAMINGKRMFHEIDFRPHGYFRGGNLVWKDTADDVAGNLREACFAIINHANLWWFDMWGHFYDEQPVRDAIAKSHEIFERFKDDNSASVSEVLYLADPESTFYMNDSGPGPCNLCNVFRRKMGTLGFPIDCYSIPDIERLDLSQYKVICLPASLVITPEKAAILRENVCRDGRTVVWCHAPGICDGKDIDSTRVALWAGVPMDTPGISRTDMGGWTAVYSPDWDDFTSGSIRQICLEAGVHSYVDETIPVFANERLLCIHCKDGGPKTITLQKKAREVVELISGEVVAKRTRKFVYDFGSPDTRLFELKY